MKNRFRVVQYEDATLVVDENNDAMVRMGSGGYSDNHRNKEKYQKIAGHICDLLNSLDDDQEVR